MDTHALNAAVGEGRRARKQAQSAVGRRAPRRAKQGAIDDALEIQCVECDDEGDDAAPMARYVQLYVLIGDHQAATRCSPRRNPRTAAAAGC